MSELMSFERLHDMVGDDETLAAEIAALFTETTKSYLDRLREALDQDNDDWSMASHALKGCCANFGASALAEMAKSCENERPSQSRITQLSKLFDDTSIVLNERFGQAVA